MPTLDWIGKKAVVNHHRDVPYRLIHCDKDKSVGDPDAGNLLVQGDNLEALKALLPYYAGKVKCIYIDPPYNTGNEGWVYNDNVSSPEIKAWLGSVVGKEAEDLSRHDKWLCMMYPRLRLLKEFLTEDGIIFISIDDNELHTLIALCEEIFNGRNWVGTIIWKNATDNNPTNISIEHEYIVCFAKEKSKIAKEWKSGASPVRERIQETATKLIEEHKDRLDMLEAAYAAWFRENKPHLWPFQEYDQIDFGGVFTGSRSVHNPGKEGYFYDIPHPATLRPCKMPLMGYRFPEETYLALKARDKIIYGKDENKIIEIKIYIDEYKSKLPSIYELDGRRGANELRAIFPDAKRTFNNPKPVELISELVSFVTGSGDIILDAFAGSGTTGHAVLEQNMKDAAQRNFVLVEMDAAIASDITAKRLQKAVSGYSKASRNGGVTHISGLGGGFRFCTLGEPLFDADGNVGPTVTYPDLAAHVFFCETGSPIPRRADGSSPLIGTFQGRAIYLLHSAEAIGVASANAGNVLTASVLDSLPLPEPGIDGARVVYAEGCTVPDDRLSRLGVTFKQIPYQIEGL
ncbi:site-specific DNA-methyltransferase [Inquilinus sp. OTU3971]|uniref:site-specific DNA-methyltransferase n=1 Tax=Inquilinus sp. OTU3971 TaxID=3043855 RepID=UPI00313AF706